LMGADSGTIVVNDDARWRGLRVIKLTWTCGAGVATFEKTAALQIRGRLLQILTKPGGTVPTAASDLAIFDAARDTSQQAGLVTAAGDGLDVITTTAVVQKLPSPQPYAAGTLR